MVSHGKTNCRSSQCLICSHLQFFPKENPSLFRLSQNTGIVKGDIKLVRILERELVIRVILPLGDMTFC